jgi:hypothetical protein
VSIGLCISPLAQAQANNREADTVTKGCEMYAGRTGRYLEMNRGEYGPPLCGKCPDPWDLVDKTRAILCDEYFTWRLSRKQRRKIKFTLLLKENTAARPED